MILCYLMNFISTSFYDSMIFMVISEKNLFMPILWINVTFMIFCDFTPRGTTKIQNHWNSLLRASPNFKGVTYEGLDQDKRWWSVTYRGGVTKFDFRSNTLFEQPPVQKTSSIYYYKPTVEEVNLRKLSAVVQICWVCDDRIF